MERRNIWKEHFNTCLDFFITLSRRKSAVLGLFIIILLLLVALFAPIIAPYDPVQLNIMNMMQPPSMEHFFGTDEYGRDIFSRVLYGARLSVWSASLAVGFCSIGGILIGLLCGFYGRLLDSIVMRIMDGMMAIPALLLAIGLIAAFGPGMMSVMLALGIVYLPRFARLVRGVVLSLREVEYVEAASALGARDMAIMFRHILPNCMAPVIVQATIYFAYAILAEASLGYLGLGVQPPAPSWGNILYDGRAYLRDAAWISIFPGLAIGFTVLGLNLLGDGLRDALDPRLKE